MFVCLLFWVPLETILLISRRDHWLWGAVKFCLCTAFVVLSWERSTWFHMCFDTMHRFLRYHLKADLKINFKKYIYIGVQLIYIFHGGRHISLRFSIVHLLICNLRKTEHKAAHRSVFYFRVQKSRKVSPRRPYDFSGWHPRTPVTEVLILLCEGHTTTAFRFLCDNFIAVGIPANSHTIQTEVVRDQSGTCGLSLFSPHVKISPLKLGI